MGLEKTTTFAGLVWVAGILAMILFKDAFASSTFGIVLGLLLTVLILAASYLILDGIWKIRRREAERAELQRQAHEDKVYELLQSMLEEEKELDLPPNQGAMDEETLARLIKKQTGVNEKAMSAVLQRQGRKNEEAVMALLEKQSKQNEETTLALLEKQNKQNEETTLALLEKQNKQNEETILALLQKQDGENEARISEWMQGELQKVEQAINSNTTHTAKLLIKYINKSSMDVMRRIGELDDED